MLNAGRCQISYRLFWEIMTGWKTRKLQVFAEQFRRSIFDTPNFMFHISGWKLNIMCFQVFIHPQYSVDGNLHYDVCLLKLDRPISFPDHPNVRCLASYGLLMPIFGRSVPFACLKTPTATMQTQKPWSLVGERLAMGMAFPPISRWFFCINVHLKISFEGDWLAGVASDTLSQSLWFEHCRQHDVRLQEKEADWRYMQCRLGLKIRKLNNQNINKSKTTWCASPRKRSQLTLLAM